VVGEGFQFFTGPGPLAQDGQILQIGWLRTHDFLSKSNKIYDPVKFTMEY
jgi:hypothetical protein